MAKETLLVVAQELMSDLGSEEWEYDESEFYDIVYGAVDYDSGHKALVALANDILWDSYRCSLIQSAETFCGC